MTEQEGVRGPIPPDQVARNLKALASIASRLDPYESYGTESAHVSPHSRGTGKVPRTEPEDPDNPSEYRRRI